MSKERLLERKVCLVTGASRGIGRAVAEKFSEEGAVVYANARIPASINDWAVECSVKNGVSVTPLYFDVTDYAAMKESVLQIMKEQNRIDILVNNAGVVSYEPLGMAQTEKIRAMFEVNVFAVISIMQLVSRIMSRQKRGSIINISSIVGLKGVKGQLAYSASKGAVISLTRSAAKELAAHNIRVNAIAPGMIDTSRLHDAMENGFKERLSDIGMGRLGKPDDIANACLFLGSDLSEYISGQILGVDGSLII